MFHKIESFILKLLKIKCLLYFSIFLFLNLTFLSSNPVFATSIDSLPDDVLVGTCGADPKSCYNCILTVLSYSDRARLKPACKRFNELSDFVLELEVRHMSSKQCVEQLLLEVKNPNNSNIHSFKKARLLLDRLLHENFDFNQAIADNGSSFLHEAVWSGSIYTVENLLQLPRVNLNIQNTFGWTPLHSASVRGRADAIALLLDAGANIELTNKFGFTPLHKAAYFGIIEVVELLLQRGANVNALDNENKTPLFWAQSFYYSEVIALLRLSGAILY